MIFNDKFIMKQKSVRKIIVGMSGGVDSSVAALLLQQEGYEVEGLFMKNWDEDDGTEYCTAMEDLSDAESVAEKLGIKLHTANFASEYWDNVFEYFLSEYSSGRTPNPDIICNREIKFRAFLDYAIELGADSIATGHYARIGSQSGKATLMTGLDTSKDQSYFLYMVGHKELEKSLFPLGSISKQEVRSIAKKAYLRTHDKKDSTGICFIGERKFKDFLQTYLPANPGEIRSKDGRYLGMHEGLMYYTIGQRKGLGVGGLQKSEESPWYVAEKDLSKNTLIVVQNNKHPALYSSALRLQDCFWISGKTPKLPLVCNARIRYRQPNQTCEIIKLNNYFKVSFSDPQRAITPGQSVVFYKKEQCIGGGIIQGIDEKK